MSTTSGPNYPDVLGHITGGARARIGVLQLAAALRPRITRAGKTFEVMVLIQNASDVELEVIATLHLPERDAKRQKDRFVSKASRLVIGLDPAEVGYALLPVSTLPDTAPSDEYKISMDVKVQPKKNEKPGRIRTSEGGVALDPEELSSNIREILNELKDLQWSVQGAGLLGGGLEVPLTVMSGKLGQFANLKPSWTSLWTLNDLMDDGLLFNKHKAAFVKILPQLMRMTVFHQLLEASKHQFNTSGVSLTPLEHELIAKIMTLIVEYARLSPRDMRFLVGGDYSIKRYLLTDELPRPDSPIELPAWAGEMLRALNRDERVAQHPVRAIGHFAFKGLLRDAMQHSFDRITAITEIDMGSAAERNHYADDFITRLNEGTLDLATIYMPLIIGGSIICDEILIDGEQPDDLIDPLMALIELRRDALSEEHEDIYELAHQFADRLFKKYRLNQW